MFSDYQLAEPPSAPRQRPAASACAFGKTDAIGRWLRRPGRQPGFPFQVAARDRRLAAIAQTPAAGSLATPRSSRTPWAVLRTHAGGHRNASRWATGLTAGARQIARSVQAGSVWRCFCAG